LNLEKNPKKQKKKKSGASPTSSKKKKPKESKPEPKPAIEEPTKELTIEQLAENQIKIANALSEVSERLNNLDTKLSGLYTALTPEGEIRAEPTPQTGAGDAIKAAIIGRLLKGEEKDPMTKLADVIVKARTISDALNLPTVWDRVLPMVVVRALTAKGLMTKEEAKLIEKEATEAIGKSRAGTKKE